MDLTSKKVAKNLIKLAISISKASVADLMILYSMVSLKLDDKQISLTEVMKLTEDIKNNEHLCALMRIKNKD